MQSIAEKSFDVVRKARHYNVHPSGVECIEIARHMSGDMFNAFKYVWRAGEKVNTQEDLGKAVYYLKDERDNSPKEAPQSTLSGVAKLVTKVTEYEPLMEKRIALTAIYGAAMQQTTPFYDFAIQAVEALSAKLKEES